MTLQRSPMPLYASTVAAKSAAGRGNPSYPRRTSAPTLAGAFFVPAMRYGGCAWDAFERAGSLGCRFSTPRTQSPPNPVERIVVTPISKESYPWKLFPTRNPSARAAAHRAMAKSALFSDSSAAVRLKRYNSHIEKARALEAEQVHIRLQPSDEGLRHLTR